MNEFFPFIFLTVAGIIWAIVVPLSLIYVDILRKSKRKRGKGNG